MHSAIAHRTYDVSLAAMGASVVTHRDLIMQLAKRDIIGRYRGSLLGLFWSLVHPLLMLAVYTFVFGVVFKSRWGIAEPSTKLEFSVILFAGLIVFGIFSECMNRSPGLVLANPNCEGRFPARNPVLTEARHGAGLPRFPQPQSQTMMFSR